MTRRIRILQVGLGDWGRDWAWRVNPTVDEAEVVGYVDSDPPALALLAKRLLRGAISSGMVSVASDYSRRHKRSSSVVLMPVPARPA